MNAEVAKYSLKFCFSNEFPDDDSTTISWIIHWITSQNRKLAAEPGNKEANLKSNAGILMKSKEGWQWGRALKNICQKCYRRRINMWFVK